MVGLHMHTNVLSAGEALVWICIIIAANEVLNTTLEGLACSWAIAFVMQT